MEIKENDVDQVTATAEQLASGINWGNTSLFKDLTEREERLSGLLKETRALINRDSRVVFDCMTAKQVADYALHRLDSITLTESENSFYGTIMPLFNAMFPHQINEVFEELFPNLIEVIGWFKLPSCTLDEGLVFDHYEFRENEGTTIFLNRFSWDDGSDLENEFSLDFEVPVSSNEVDVEALRYYLDGIKVRQQELIANHKQAHKGE